MTLEVLTSVAMKILPSRLQCRAVWWIGTNVSGEPAASIFRVEECIFYTDFKATDYC
jgi:hypothetical protein